MISKCTELLKPYKDTDGIPGIKFNVISCQTYEPMIQSRSTDIATAWMDDNMRQVNENQELLDYKRGIKIIFNDKTQKKDDTNNNVFRFYNRTFKITHLQKYDIDVLFFFNKKHTHTYSYYLFVLFFVCMYFAHSQFKKNTNVSQNHR